MIYLINYLKFLYCYILILLLFTSCSSTISKIPNESIGNKRALGLNSVRTIAVDLVLKPRIDENPKIECKLNNQVVFMKENRKGLLPDQFTYRSDNFYYKGRYYPLPPLPNNINNFAIEKYSGPQLYSVSTVTINNQDMAIGTGAFGFIYVFNGSEKPKAINLNLLPAKKTDKGFDKYFKIKHAIIPSENYNTIDDCYTSPQCQDNF